MHTSAVSKSFRAVLPGVACDKVALLRRYCADNFVASAVFVESGDVIWLATSDTICHRAQALGKGGAGQGRCGFGSPLQGHASA